MDKSQAEAIIMLVDIIARGISMSARMRSEYNQLTQELKTMVREDRNPTPEEWEELNRRTQDLGYELEAAAEAHLEDIV